MSQEISQ